MERHVLVVHSNPAPGREDEYNACCTDQHLAEVVAVPGFVAAPGKAPEATKANRIIPASMHPDRLSVMFTPIASLRRE
jgi:hypothetical protein